MKNASEFAAQHITDPRTTSNLDLRDLALAAALVAKLDETFEEVENLGIEWTIEEDVPERADCPGETIYDLDELTGEEIIVQEGTGEPCAEELWLEDPVFVAMRAVEEKMVREANELEAGVAAWLAADEGNWPEFRALVFDPWQKGAGRYHQGTPRWIVRLGSLKAVESYVTPYPWSSWEPRARIYSSERTLAGA